MKTTLRKPKTHGRESVDTRVRDIKDCIDQVLTRHDCDVSEKEWLLNAFAYCLKDGAGCSAGIADRLCEQFLYHWAEWQKADYRAGKLTAREISQLEAIPYWTWDSAR